MEVFVLDASGEETQTAMKKGLEEHSALLVGAESETAPPLNSEVEVSILGVGEVEAVRVSGRLVQLLPTGTGVVLVNDSAKQLVMGAGFDGTGFDGTAGAAEDNTADSADDEKSRADQTAPLWAQFAAMSKQEKLKLARNGNADARRIVLKDRDQSLHQHVLNNPGLTSKEVAAFVKNKLASPAFIKRILERTEFMSNATIVEALVFNPHTPTRDAVKLVGKISNDAARRITKMQALREPIVRAARKRVHKR